MLRTAVRDDPPALLVLGFAGLAHGASAAETARFTDARTGVAGWRFEAHGIRVQLIQRLPDQTKAFFLGRGIDLKTAARLAERCLFQTIVHNTYPPGGPNVHVDLHQQTLTGRGPEPLLLKETWQQEWGRAGLGKRARIAFQWAFFPSVQNFLPGDWNMGMTSYPVAPGEDLVLEIIWYSGGQRHHHKMAGMVCGDNDMAAEIAK